jgi:hypothetical protein
MTNPMVQHCVLNTLLQGRICCNSTDGCCGQPYSADILRNAINVNPRRSEAPVKIHLRVKTPWPDAPEKTLRQKSDFHSRLL